MGMSAPPLPAALEPLPRALRWLVPSIGILSVIAAVGGLAWPSDGEPFTVTSVRGSEVEVFGRGLYGHDSLFKAGANQGSDVTTLVVGVPLLALSALWALRGSLRGRLLLLGALVYFLYVYASYALAIAYNDLFLVYVALFAASLYALVMAFTSIAPAALAARFRPGLPRPAPAVLMFASTTVLVSIWLMEPLASLLADEEPRHLGASTTMFTNALDLAVLAPATFIAGLLIRRRQALGYLIALSLLVLEAMLAPMIALQTLFQVEAGVSFTAGEVVGPIAGFVVLAAVALWVMARLLSEISEQVP
jgi:hypothetical protein